jgi:hypothetical protein
VKAAKEVDPWPRENFNVVERIGRRVFPALGHNERRELLQPCDLPVDVQHFLFEESGAIAGDNRRGHVGQKGSDTAADRLTRRDCAPDQKKDQNE